MKMYRIGHCDIVIISLNINTNKLSVFYNFNLELLSYTRFLRICFNSRVI